MSGGVFEVGRVCVQLRGRRAGQKVVVVDQASPSRVVVEGLSVKRRTCNVEHLFATPKKVELARNPSREEVVKALG